ncbi:hypothetical protein ABPG74_011589 [Tetrahymena malaccensis]
MKVQENYIFGDKNQANPQDVSDSKAPIIFVTNSSQTQIEEDINTNLKQVQPQNRQQDFLNVNDQNLQRDNLRQDGKQEFPKSIFYYQKTQNKDLIPYPQEDSIETIYQTQNVEMKQIKTSFLTVPQQQKNYDTYQQIYTKKSTIASGQPLKVITEDPRGSISDTNIDKFSIDQYDCREQDLPSERPSNDSYIQRKPKTSVVYGSGFAFHVEDICEVREDSLLFKDKEGQVQKVIITNQLTNDINKVSRYFKKPILLKPVYQNVNISYAWVLLFLGTIANGIIPSWIQYMPAEKYLRIAWRFFMQFFLMIPFAQYEWRTGDEKIKAKYSISYILKSENLKKLFLSSFTQSTWFCFTLFCFEWTYVSHAIILGNLVNFYLFLQRVVRKDQIHYIEIFGGIITFLGVTFVLADNIFFDASDLPPSAYHYKMTKFIHRPNWQRVLFGNGSSLIVSFLMSKLAKHQAAAREVFPAHLNTILTFFLNMFNLTLLSYFFSGMDFVKDPSWGWYGLFTEQNFVSFLLMSILLGMGSFVSMFIVSKVFVPLVPQTAQLFEPVISTLALQALGVQILPEGLTCLGYALILPGLFSIILGQYFIQQQNQKKS